MDAKQEKILEKIIIDNYTDIIRSMMKDGLTFRQSINLIKLYITNDWFKKEEKN